VKFLPAFCVLEVPTELDQWSSTRDLTCQFPCDRWDKFGPNKEESQNSKANDVCIYAWSFQWGSLDQNSEYGRDDVVVWMLVETWKEVENRCTTWHFCSKCLSQKDSASTRLHRALTIENKDWTLFWFTFFPPKMI